MSILRRVLQRFLKPNYFVGRDLEGNKYYECPNANDGRSKRTVQYKQTDDMWAYIASNERLPDDAPARVVPFFACRNVTLVLKLRAVQWTAWLTHTRPTPPTIEELQADLARQQRVQMNAAILEARDREERERMARLAQAAQAYQASHSQVAQPYLENPSKAGPSESPVDTHSDSPSSVRDPWAEGNRGSDEPQPWNPIVRRK